MPVVHTDDEARSLRYRWLGPVEFRTPWDWTGPQWVAGSTALVAGLAATYLVAPPFLGWLAAIAVVLLAAYAAGRWTGSFTAAETGPRYYLLTLLEEVSAQRARTTTTRRSALHPGLTSHAKKGQL